jgi:hypothetical protein
MTNTSITYVVAACSAIFGLAAFVALVVVPGVTAYRRVWERVAAVALSGYVLVALIGLGILLGAAIVVEWPRVF